VTSESLIDAARAKSHPTANSAGHLVVPVLHGHVQPCCATTHTTPKRGPHQHYPGRPSGLSMWRSVDSCAHPRGMFGRYCVRVPRGHGTVAARASQAVGAPARRNAHLCRGASIRTCAVVGQGRALCTAAAPKQHQRVAAALYLRRADALSLGWPFCMSEYAVETLPDTGWVYLSAS